MTKFFSDIALDGASPLTLLLSKYMNAKVMGEFTFDEFQTGFKALNCSSTEELKKKMP